VALSQRSRTLLKRLVQVLLAVELVWLVVINGALALPLTQTLINTIRPEKFFISWDRAWSWYPGNVQVRGVFANGQSRSQQWQFETPEASGSVALLPLAIKRVHVRRARALDVDFRLRPRFKEGRDYSRFLPWYPDIEGWASLPRARRNAPGTSSSTTSRSKASMSCGCTSSGVRRRPAFGPT
jgi:hypothetical protein